MTAKQVLLILAVICWVIEGLRGAVATQERPIATGVNFLAIGLAFAGAGLWLA